MDFVGVEELIVLNDPEACPFPVGPTLRASPENGILTREGKSKSINWPFFLSGFPIPSVVYLLVINRKKSPLSS